MVSPRIAVTAPMLAPPIRIQARLEAEVRALVFCDERLGVIDVENSFGEGRFPFGIDPAQLLNRTGILLDV